MDVDDDAPKEFLTLTSNDIRPYIDNDYFRNIAPLSIVYYFLIVECRYVIVTEA